MSDAVTPLPGPPARGKRWHLPLLLALWALIYLPALGGPEFKGEEPRRVQPALAMMGSGEWIVPHVGGEPYYNKPPLINWLVAAAFYLGGQSEFSARMVSAVAVLAMMLGIFGWSKRWMGAERAFFAAIAATTHVSMVDKGRLIEIEPLYIALFSLALVLWLRLFLEAGAKAPRREQWALWILPWLFLGLGILVKGPIHLLFFYAVIVPVALFHGRWRVLLSWAHLAGVAAGTAVFLAWAVPLFAKIPGGDALKTWRGQMGSRLAGEADRLVSFEFLLNLPKGLANFLPWTLLLLAALGVLWGARRKRPAPALAPPALEMTSRGVLAGFLPLFILLGLIPGILPRYTMPLFTPAALWLACVLPLPGGRPRTIWEWTNRILGGLGAACGAAGFFFATSAAGWVFCALAVLCGLFALRRQAGATGAGLDLLAGRTAGAIAAAVLVYAAVVVPRMEARDDVRPVAREILARTNGGASLCLVDPESRPFIAYLPPSVRFAPRFSAVPEGTAYVILKASAFKELTARERERIGEVWEFRDRGRERFVLAELKNPLPPPPGG